MHSAPFLAWVAGVKKFIGGKGNHGLFERIINLIPPHRVYLELFGGLAAIARKKKPAAVSIVCDKTRNPDLVLPDGVEFHEGCALEYVRQFWFTGDEFIYADPPYVKETRGSRRYYAHEWSWAQHIIFLKLMIKIGEEYRIPILISGYRSQIYDEFLDGWNREDVPTWTRNHNPRTECLWFNYPRPVVLHEYGKVGKGTREIQRIKKKVKRWRERLARQSPVERSALFSALVDVMGPDAVRIALHETEARPRAPEPARLEKSSPAEPVSDPVVSIRPGAAVRAKKGAKDLRAESGADCDRGDDTA